MVQLRECMIMAGIRTDVEVCEYDLAHTIDGLGRSVGVMVPYGGLEGGLIARKVVARVEEVI